MQWPGHVLAGGPPVWQPSSRSPCRCHPACLLHDPYLITDQCEMDWWEDYTGLSGVKWPCLVLAGGPPESMKMSSSMSATWSTSDQHNVVYGKTTLGRAMGSDLVSLHGDQLFDSLVLGSPKWCTPACPLHIPCQIADQRNVVRREDYAG